MKTEHRPLLIACIVIACIAIAGLAIATYHYHRFQRLFITQDIDMPMEESAAYTHLYRILENNHDALSMTFETEAEDLSPSGTIAPEDVQAIRQLLLEHKPSTLNKGRHLNHTRPDHFGVLLISSGVKMSEIFIHRDKISIGCIADVPGIHDAVIHARKLLNEKQQNNGSQKGDK